MHKLPKRNPQVLKSCFQVSTPRGSSREFLHQSYELLPSNHLVVVHYLGNENAANNFPHGNVKHTTREHVRTCPSVLKSLDVKCGESSTSKIYKSLITKLPAVSHMPVLQPRNSKQVENVRVKKLQDQRISHDALYNLHELAVDMPTGVVLFT